LALLPNCHCPKNGDAMLEKRAEAGNNPATTRQVEVRLAMVDARGALAGKRSSSAL
jgi:hypothetical protein